MLEQGEDEEQILRQAYRRGIPPPDVMRDAPELPADLLPFWQAYDELSTCRQFAGMSGVPMPIPWTAIDKYAIRHRYAGDEYDDLVSIVRAVDDAFRKHAMEKAKQDGGS